MTSSATRRYRRYDIKAAQIHGLAATRESTGLPHGHDAFQVDGNGPKMMKSDKQDDVKISV
jgi:hypothetical protein